MRLDTQQVAVNDGVDTDYLGRASALAPMIEAAATIPAHEAYMADLKAKHARKTSFWPKVAEAGVAI